MIDVDTLKRMYIDQDMTMKEIGDALGVCAGTVFKNIKRYNIPVRKTMRADKRAYVSMRASEALKGKKRAPFTEEHKKKISDGKKGKCWVFSKYGGHRKKRPDGYVCVFCPKHPNATKDGYVMEHILVMEAQIGKYIPRDYVVHHKNGIRDDNRIENLELMTFKEHSALHIIERHKNGEIRYYTRPVMNIDTGETFRSVKEAGVAYSVSPSHISAVCMNHRKTAMGFHWKYIDAKGGDCY